MAYPLFKELQSQLKETDHSNNALHAQDIKYYTLVCALKQNEKGAVQPAREFIDLENNTGRAELMSFHLAEYFFWQKNYNDAAHLYEQAGIDNLNNREVADMKFHLGILLFYAKPF